MSLATDILRFTDLVQNWASNISDVFFSNVAKDVPIKVLDNNGEVVEITVPNHKKMSDTFDTWKSQINIKNLNGVVVDELGNDLTVNKFGGLTLAEYNTLYNTFMSKDKIKLVPETGPCSQMVAFQSMAVVTESNVVLAWGYNRNNQLSYGLSTQLGNIVELQQAPEKKGVNITKLWYSGSHIAILYEDGDLYVRGQQGQGHLGIGNTALQLKFVKSASNVVDYITSSNGDQDEQPSAAYIDTLGNVWRSGDNGHGELGVGDTTERHAWAMSYDASGHGDSKVTQVVINGDDQASAYYLNDVGGLFVTGHNAKGSLGNGGTDQVNTLTQIVPNIRDGYITKIVANGYCDATYSGSAFILTSVGRVFSTGYNEQGQLGLGNTSDSASFTEIIYGHDVSLDPVVGIFAFHRTSAYLTQSGDLWAVGQANNGSLGDGTTTNTSSYKNILSNVKEFYPSVNADASQYPSLYAITNDNKLWSWGNGAYGQLGHYGTADVLAPTEIRFNGVEDIVKFSHNGYANQGSVYALKTDGTLYGCGRNNYAQITIHHNEDEYVSEFMRIRI